MMFELNLEVCLDSLEHDEILIISRQNVNQFVQVKRDDYRLVMEAAGNNYIDPPQFLLTQRQHRQMLALTWMPANVTAEESDARDRHRRFVSEPGIDGCELFDEDGTRWEPQMPDESEEFISPNYHRLMGIRNQDRIAILFRTLHDVYRIRRVADLQYASFHAITGEPIRWPTLGIPRAD